jgi:ribulose-phosphate 3-epimerase
MRASSPWPSDRLLAEISLWSADLCRMADDVARLEPYTDMFHLDVADGHFSPRPAYVSRSDRSNP